MSTALASPPATRRPAVWHVPTRVVTGCGALAALAPACREAGRVLEVTDGDLAEGPIAAGALRALREAGVACELYPGASPHPPLSAATEAAAAARDFDAAAVVGLGGGSSLDVAKVAALAARAPEVLEHADWAGDDGIVVARPPVGTRPLALVQVPTTPGTGSEASSAASLTDAANRKRLLLHPSLYARLAIVDPALHVSLPPRATAEAAVDTLCRVAIPFLTDRADRPLQDATAAAIARTIFERTPAALKDPADLDARTDLALAATSSQLGWASLGRDPFGHVLWYLEHGLATCTGAAKGSGLAALLPSYLEHVLDHGDGLPRFGRAQRLATLGRLALDVGEADDGLAARRTAQRFVACLRAWELPTSLREIGLDAPGAAELAAATRRQWCGREGVLGWLDPKEIDALYAAALA